MTRTAVVVGGGIGGLAAAAGLIRNGWDVRVLEQAEDFTAVGAGISLWPNAFRAMDAIGALDRLVTERLYGSGGIRDWRGSWIVRLDGNPEVAEVASAAVVTHRADLLDALLAGVPSSSRLPGTRVRDLRVEGARTVVEYEGTDDPFEPSTHTRSAKNTSRSNGFNSPVSSSGGGEIAADLVVGADGVNSVVRRAIFPDAAPPVYSRRTAWRLIMPLPPGLISSETMGPGAVFGILPMPGQRLYCYGSATVPAGGRSPDGELAELRRRFAGWHDPIPSLLASAKPEQVLRNDIYYLPPLKTYVAGRVVLLGDAAHAMTPNLGQGGCQALEDAATLAAVMTGTSDLDAALRRYDALRRPRTQALAKRSKSTGELAQLSWRPAMAARNLAMRLMPTSMFVRSLTSTFDWYPPSDTDQTDRVIS